jgi:hypothetical protein
MLKGHAHHKTPDTSKPWYDVVHCATWEFEIEPGVWVPTTYFMYIVVQDNKIIDKGLSLSEQDAKLQATQFIAKLQKQHKKKQYIPTTHTLHLRGEQ